MAADRRQGAEIHEDTAVAFDGDHTVRCRHSDT
jgi:hypothetical protein